jgi:hypothetical protein
MKFLKFLSIFLAAAFIFTACEKEYSYEDGTAKGSLKKDDASGDCLPQTVNGTYVKDTLLKAATNFVDLQVNVTETGAYDIRTDTVNGYYFRAVGSTANTGLNTIRLIGAGKPIAASIDEFTVAFDTSHCTFSVQVTATAVTTGAFILGTATDHCTGIAVQGTYTASTAMTATNKVSVPITITNPGTFTLTATPATTDNGVTFSVAGTLVSNGTATVDLAASGTPTAAGAFVYNLSDGTNSCSFTVTYGAAAPPATFTIDCTGATFIGTYQAGASAAGNTVTISATPTTTGSYSITTPVVNGVSFSGTGTFTTTVAQPVVLTATGTAGATTGSVAYLATGGASTCTFNVTYTAAAGPAAFTINCGTAVANGDYYRGIALGASNTITLPVTVTTIGSYSISAPAVNGVSFSKTGTFTATGAQNVTLDGTGTSTAGGDVVYTTTNTNSATNCSFTVTYDFVDLTLAGTPMQMNFYDTAQYYTNASLPGYTILEAYGASNLNHDDEIYLDIARTTAPPFATGTYSASGTGYLLAADYIDAAGNDYTVYPGGPAGPFTITLTTSSATRIIGTYTGTLTDETTSATKVVSGAFNLKLH